MKHLILESLRLYKLSLLFIATVHTYLAITIAIRYMEQVPMQAPSKMGTYLAALQISTGQLSKAKKKTYSHIIFTSLMTLNHIQIMTPRFVLQSFSVCVAQR